MRAEAARSKDVQDRAVEITKKNAELACTLHAGRNDRQGTEVSGTKR